MGENKTNEQIKAEVLELLNKIVLLTKDVKEGPTFEDYNYNRRAVTTSQLDYHSDAEELLKDLNLTEADLPALDTQAYLHSVGAYAKRVVNGSSESALQNELQYYNSNCY